MDEYVYRVFVSMETIYHGYVEHWVRDKSIRSHTYNLSYIGATIVMYHSMISRGGRVW